MAIKPNELFIGKITDPDAAYPLGSARNVTTPGDGTGTPLVADLLNDIFGFQQSLLSAAGLTANGNPDSVNNSQYKDAILALTLGKLLENTGAGIVGTTSGKNIQEELNILIAKGALFYDTLAGALSDVNLLEGNTLIIKDRASAVFDAVLASGVTTNIFNTVVCTGASTLALDLRIGDQTTVEEWGVVAGVNSGPATNAAADYCRANGATLTSKSGASYTTDESINFRNLKSLAYKSQIVGTADFITVVLGGDSTDTSQYYNQYVHKANRGGASPAVRLIGANKCTIRVDEASIFEIYADTDSSTLGADEYTAYNRIFVQSCTTFQINSNPSSNGSIVQWVNENQIYLQFCVNFKCFDNGYQHNGNQFFGGNFEGGSSKIEWNTGIGNTMNGVRGEDSLAISFGANSANNVILTDWFGSENNPAAGASVTSLGLNNCVKNQNDLSNDRVMIMSCNGSTLTDDGTSKSNLLGMNYGLTKDAVNNTITAVSNQVIYTSPFIEINTKDQYFGVEVVPKLSGGITMKIEGWDSSMNSISSTGLDVFFEGATNESAGFGENSTTITNEAAQRRIHITNSSAKYIRLTVRASSLGCSFRRFTVEAVTANKNGKKELQASAMIFDI